MTMTVLNRKSVDVPTRDIEAAHSVCISTGMEIGDYASLLSNGGYVNEGPSAHQQASHKYGAPTLN